MTSAVGEFDLIARWFTRAPARADLGVGDDCALLSPRPGMQWAISTDLSVEGRHFLSTAPPKCVGHKSLAVNLSDLAACGAEPRAFTLSLSMPRVEPAFLEGFAEGLWALAERCSVDLVGGDTTSGPLTIGITVFGEVPSGAALLRSGAVAGHDIWVSGSLGDARLALEVFRGTVSASQEDFTHARRAMELPEPRIALGLALRGLASSAIDLSDGLLGDLRHILHRSGVGAVIEEAHLPRSPALQRQSADIQRLCLLAGGDDYELLFTAPSDRRSEVLAASQLATTPVTRIGQVTPQPGLVVRDVTGRPLDVVTDPRLRSFDHFAT